MLYLADVGRTLGVAAAAREETHSHWSDRQIW